MPDSVLMPAPVKTTARRLPCKISLNLSIGELPVLKSVIRRFGFGTAKMTSSITLNKRRPGFKTLSLCLLKLQSLRLPSVEDRFDDVRREQREPQEAINKGHPFRSPATGTYPPPASAATGAPAPALGSACRTVAVDGASAVAAIGRDDSISISRKSTLDSANRSRPSLPKVE
jgi:hypothetical protein